MSRSVGNYFKESLGMYRKILLLGCLLPFLASCYNDLYNVSATYEVELFGNASIKEFVSDSERIRLQSDDAFIISEISKICCDTAFIYLLNGKEVLVFDADGVYKSKISRQGRANTEYVAITDFDVYENDIYILSNPQRKICVYSAEGTFIRSVDLNDWYHNLSVGNGYILLYSEKSNGQMYDVVKIDFNGRVQNKFVPFKTQNGVRYGTSPFYEIGTDDYLFTFPYDNNIYRYVNNEVYPFCTLKLSSAINLSANELYESDYDSIKKRLNGETYLRRVIGASFDEDTLYLMMEVNYATRALRHLLCRIDMASGRVDTYLCGEQIEPEFPYFNCLTSMIGDTVYSVVNSYYMNHVDGIINGVKEDLPYDKLDEYYLYKYYLKTNSK